MTHHYCFYIHLPCTVLVPIGSVMMTGTCKHYKAVGCKLRVRIVYDLCVHVTKWYYVRTLRRQATYPHITVIIDSILDCCQLHSNKTTFDFHSASSFRYIIVSVVKKSISGGAFRTWTCQDKNYVWHL